MIHSGPEKPSAARNHRHAATSASQQVESVALVDVGDVECVQGVGPRRREHLREPLLAGETRDPSEQHVGLGIDRLDRVVCRAQHPRVLQGRAGEEASEVGLVPDLPVVDGRVGAAHDLGDLGSIVGEVIGPAQRHLRYVARRRTRRDPPWDRRQVGDDPEVVGVGQRDHLVQAGEVRRLQRVVEHQRGRDVEADRGSVHRGRFLEHRLHERIRTAELKHRVGADRAFGGARGARARAEQREARRDRHHPGQSASTNRRPPPAHPKAIYSNTHSPIHRSERSDLNAGPVRTVSCLTEWSHHRLERRLQAI